MHEIIFSLPSAFIVAMLFTWLLAYLFSRVETPFRQAGGKTEPYACGEEFPAEKVEPDYTQFFPFAIFFTLLHVAALVLATWGFAPQAGPLAAAAYICGVLLTLAVLFLK